ncbi:MAG: hypothetical protein KDK70_15775 [Myxococcales bacterium]|nr:hypothetical protein [Myxococcales bacterium]
MQTTHTEPLEQAFTASIIADDRLRARTRETLRQTLEDCGVFGGDPARVDELLRLTDTYQTYACPARVDDESLLIAGLYGMIIILHGTGILTGEHLELGPEAFVRHLRTGALEHDDPPESARLLAELGRRLAARSMDPKALDRFVHYAERTYRAYLDKRDDLLQGRHPGSLAEYQDNRRFRIGIYPWVWLWIALDGFALPIQRPRDEHLGTMLGLVNQITYMRNDIATLRRDLHDGLENYILFLEADLGCDRARAIEVTKERCNDQVRELLALERTIRSAPGDYPEAAPYLDFLRSLLVGNLLALEAFSTSAYVERDTLLA